MTSKVIINKGLYVLLRVVQGRARQYSTKSDGDTHNTSAMSHVHTSEERKEKSKNARIEDGRGRDTCVSLGTGVNFTVEFTSGTDLQMQTLERSCPSFS